MIKKKESIIILSVIVVLGVCLAFIRRAPSSAQSVRITQDNKVLYTVSLYKDAEIELEHNIVVIEKGYVYVREADCKNQICVNTGKISQKGEQIICLPNKVIVEVTSLEN